MTVCIAALCNGPYIIGASDRMLTAGDVQFEPQQTKIVAPSNSIAIMVAGDSALQAEILHWVRAEVIERIEAKPEAWVAVIDVASIYSTHCKRLRFRHAENAILSPLGLDNETFMRRQKEMAPELVTKLATELLNFRMPSVEAIVTGIDMSGAHIYTLDNAAVTCQDLVGFAAIGAGYWHANSQFMFGGHTKAKPMPETLLLTYSAKKRAEVAPGVGEGTDMFMVGPTLGSYFPIGEHVLAQLEEFYQETQAKIRDAASEAEDRVNEYVEELGRAASQAREQTAGVPDAGTNPPADEETNRPKPPEAGGARETAKQ